MKRIIFLVAVLFVFAHPSLAAQVRLQRAYIATHGHLDGFLIAPNGRMVPMGYKGLPKNFDWTLPSSVSVPTLKQAGSVVATPNGKYLYVAGCARDRTQTVRGENPFLEEIAAYRLDAQGIPHRLGSPTQIDDCLTGNAGPYQTLVISRDGAYLFAAGGISYDVHDSTNVHSFAISANGTLTRITTVKVPGFPASAYIALDSTEKWLFVAGVYLRQKSVSGTPLVLTEFRVAGGGSLALAATIPFAGKLDAFNGLASLARRPLLYVSGVTISNSGATTRVFSYRIDADGALMPVIGSAVVDTGLTPTAQPNYASLATAPSGRLLYVMGSSTTRRDRSLIRSYVIGQDGRLRAARGSTIASKALAQPQMIVLDATGGYLYEMDQSAGFMGAPAILEFRTFPDGAITPNRRACLGGGPDQVSFCGRVPALTGPMVILR